MFNINMEYLILNINNNSKYFRIKILRIKSYHKITSQIYHNPTLYIPRSFLM